MKKKMNNRQQLINKAERHIDNLLLLIQLAKQEREWEWDKQHPWVERDGDGKFAETDSSNTSEKETEKDDEKVDSEEKKPLTSREAIQAKLSKKMQAAKKELSKIKETLDSVTDESLEKTKEILNSPEIKEIHEKTKAALDSVSKDMGAVYEKAQNEIKDFNPKRVTKTIERKLNEIQGKATLDPDDLAKAYNLLDLFGAVCQLNGAATIVTALVLPLVVPAAPIALTGLAVDIAWTAVDIYFFKTAREDFDEKVKEGVLSKSDLKTQGDMFRNSVDIVSDGIKGITNIMVKNEDKEWSVDTFLSVL